MTDEVSTPLEVAEPVTEAPSAPEAVAVATPKPPERTQDVRDDNSPILNEFVKVVDGEHVGRVAAFLHVVDFDKVTGFPHSVMVRTRDAGNELLQVLYDHIRPHRSYKGGR